MAWLSVTDYKDLQQRPQLTPDQERRRRDRSVAIAVALGALVLIMIAITLAKGPAIFLPTL